VISLEEFLCAGEQNQGDSRPRCLLTFDDGWRDNYTRAYPILRKFNSSATIFLVTEMVGTTGGFWVERLRNTWKNPSERRRMIPVVAERLASRNGGPEINLEDVVEYLKHLPAQERNGLLERLLPSPETEEAANDLDRMMTWEEAAELARNGVELGAHTATHPILTHEDNATVCHELTTCKETLEEKLARPARAFAYPNGNWNEGVRAQVERAGFQCAFTTRRRWYCPGDDPFTIPRFIIHEKKISGLDGEFSPALFSLTLARWA